MRLVGRPAGIHWSGVRPAPDEWEALVKAYKALKGSK